MATLTASAAQADRQAIFNVTGDTTRIVTRNVAGVTVSAGDVWQMLKIPSGAIVSELAFFFDAGGAGNYTVGIGDGGSTGRYISSLSTQASSVTRMTTVAGIGYSYSVEDTVDIIWSTVTSGTAATGIATVRVTYTLNNGG